jgi:hypothetical protein
MSHTVCCTAVALLVPQKVCKEEFGILNGKGIILNIRCCIMIQPNTWSFKSLYLSNTTTAHHVPSFVTFSDHFSFETEKIYDPNSWFFIYNLLS